MNTVWSWSHASPVTNDEVYAKKTLSVPTKSEEKKQETNNNKKGLCCSQMQKKKCLAMLESSTQNLNKSAMKELDRIKYILPENSNKKNAGKSIVLQWQTHALQHTIHYTLTHFITFNYTISLAEVRSKVKIIIGKHKGSNNIVSMIVVLILWNITNLQHSLLDTVQNIYKLMDRILNIFPIFSITTCKYQRK